MLGNWLLSRAPFGMAAMLSLLAALSAPALAQPTPDQQNAIRSNCRSDAMSTCPGMRGADALRCLQKNVSSLSPACKGAISVTMPAAPAPAPAASASPPPKPAAPVASPAPAAPPPAASAPAPAAAAAKPVAPPPPAAVAKPAPAPAAAKPAPSPNPAATASRPAAPLPPAAVAPAPPPPMRLRQATLRELMVIRRVCAGDIVVHCRAVPPGDGRIAMCLAEHGPALSPACNRALAPLQN